MSSCYGCFSVRPLRSSFFRPGPHVSDAGARGAVKVGRCVGVDTSSAISRPRLDGPEHGGTMVCAGISRSLVVAALVVDRGEIPKRGVPPPRIVEALDEDGDARLGLRLEFASIEQLTFERGEETLRHRIIVGVSDRPHRGANSSLPTSFAERDRGILRALIRMVDHAARPPLPERHVESVEYHLRMQGRRHRPADNPSAERVEHDGQIEEAGPRRNIRDVSHPQHVRALSREVAVDEIGRLTRPIPDGRDGVSATADAGQAGGSHQPGNTFATDTNAGSRKIDLQAWRSIRAFRGGMRRADCHDQRGVDHGTLRGRPLRPRVIAAGGDAQDAAHHGNGVTGPVLAHEWEPFGGITSVSRANQAAAFERISRSNLSWRFSRRRRLSSSRSAVVRPSPRRPSSRSARATQLRIACADGSNSFASSSGVRPAQTSSIICRRNSGGYGVRFLAIVNSENSNVRVSTKPGQLQTTIGTKTSYRIRRVVLAAPQPLFDGNSVPGCRHADEKGESIGSANCRSCPCVVARRERGLQGRLWADGIEQNRACHPIAQPDQDEAAVSRRASPRRTTRGPPQRPLPPGHIRSPRPLGQCQETVGRRLSFTCGGPARCCVRSSSDGWRLLTSKAKRAPAGRARFEPGVTAWELRAGVLGLSLC